MDRRLSITYFPPIFPCQSGSYTDRSTECDLTFITNTDLHNAFGRVGYNLAIQATISRSSTNPSSQFVLNSVAVVGFIYDHYQWNPFQPGVTIPIPMAEITVPADHELADMQAGFLSLGSGGMVYQSQVNLNSPALTGINYTFQ